MIIPEIVIVHISTAWGILILRVTSQWAHNLDVVFAVCIGAFQRRSTWLEPEVAFASMCVSWAHLCAWGLRQGPQLGLSEILLNILEQRHAAMQHVYQQGRATSFEVHREIGSILSR